MKRPDIAAEIEKGWRLMTAPFRVLPSFVIAGAPKCGTSTLYDAIAAHPQVRRGARKEPTNFIHYPGSRYRSAMHYPFAAGGKFIVGDGSVEYFMHPDGARNAHDVLPDARLIFLLRDPVRRAWSDYQMFRKHGDETEEFDERVRRAIGWLSDPDLDGLVAAAAREAFNPVRYVLAGMYARALDRWFAVFPRERCLVLISEEFFADPETAVTAVYRHLGLSDAPVAKIAVAREGKYSDSMTKETEEVLRGFYRPENERLAELLGRELPWGDRTNGTNGTDVNEGG